MEVKNSYDIVWFKYADGTQGAWCKDYHDGTYGYFNRTHWQPNENCPNPLEYTEILEISNECPAIARLLEQLMLLYKLYGS